MINIFLSSLKNKKRSKIFFYFFFYLVPRAGLEPAQVQYPKDFKSFASTKFRHLGIHFNFVYNLTYHYSYFQNQDFFHCYEKNLEAAPGFEPGVKVLQTSALPLGYAAAHQTHIYLLVITPSFSSIIFNSKVSTIKTSECLFSGFLFSIVK